jgi:hypothetical protein
MEGTKVNVNLTPIIPLPGLASIFQLTLDHPRSSSMLLQFLYVLSPQPRSLPRSYSVFLTVPLAAGGGQQLPHR